MSDNPYSTPTWKWEPNIIVSVWGRAKATLVGPEKCPRPASDCTAKPDGRSYASDATYPGDCDNCKHFRGIDLRGSDGAVWGQHFGGCCGLILDPSVPKQKYGSEVEVTQ